MIRKQLLATHTDSLTTDRLPGCTSGISGHLHKFLCKYWDPRQGFPEVILLDVLKRPTSTPRPFGYVFLFCG